MRLPAPLHVANEALAFALELAMLVALSVWGAKTGATLPVSVVVGAGAPLAAAVVWGLFAAPKASVRLPIWGVLAIKAIAFGCGAFALAALGMPGLGAAFAAVCLVNTAVATVDRAARGRGGPG